jgi:hypothetical protein
MTWSTRNTGKEWSDSDLWQLRKLANEGTPAPVIALRLGRTPSAIYSRASSDRKVLRREPSSHEGECVKEPYSDAG